MIVPFERLSADALRAILLEFIGREGTDYGDAADVPLRTKIDQIMKQLRAGDAFVVFDTETETCNLLTRRDVQSLGLLNRD